MREKSGESRESGNEAERERVAKRKIGRDEDGARNFFLFTWCVPFVIF